MKKNNEIQLRKNKMDLNNRKMKNHPPSPVIQGQIFNENNNNSKTLREFVPSDSITTIYTFNTFKVFIGQEPPK